MVNAQLVMDVLVDRYDYAQMLDYNFNKEDYEWLLGVEIIDALRREYNPDYRYNDEDDGFFVLDIPVTLDLKDEWRVSLVKEIKR